MLDDLRMILKKYRVNITKPRLLMLKTFLSSAEPRTHAYFVSPEGLGLDRTTVFRNLRVFQKKNIIYSIPTTDGICRYLLKRRNTDQSIRGFANFICNRCKKIMPLAIMKPPEVELPEGCEQKSMEIIIEGFCKSCKNH